MLKRVYIYIPLILLFFALSSANALQVDYKNFYYKFYGKTGVSNNFKHLYDGYDQILAGVSQTYKTNMSLGYRFTNNIRGEVESSVFETRHFYLKENLQKNTYPKNTLNIVRTKYVQRLSSKALLINMYYSFCNNKKLKPYISFGTGVNNIKVKPLMDLQASPIRLGEEYKVDIEHESNKLNKNEINESYIEKSKYSLACQLVLGLLLDISDYIAISADYKLVYSGYFLKQKLYEHKKVFLPKTLASVNIILKL